jgi:hypothetical protein
MLRSMTTSRVARVGSYYKKTAIDAVSDLDFFVVIRREEARWSGSLVASITVLNNVRAAIIDRYSRSAVGRDGSAIAVSFASGIPIDVVPAIFANPLNTGHPLYSIPDGEGGWLETSPDAQRMAFAAADLRSGGKLRRSVQLVKAWAHYREAPLPISSFYVETVLATSRVAEGVRSYSAILADSFQLLANRGTASLKDPLGISGYIRPARTEAQRTSLSRSLSFAAEHAGWAHDAECEADGREAVRQWQMLLPGFRAL